jgi:tRNA A-37 threonylcarbamoyl transferase component Bud32
MAKLVVFDIKDKEGDFSKGFPVSLRIREDGRIVGQKVDAFLPPNPDLLEHYRNWQCRYISLVSSLHSSRQVKARRATNVSNLEIIAAREQLKGSINDWLNSEDLMPIIHKLDEKLSKTDDILFVVNTKNSYLQRLPWHFWDVFDNLSKAEVALSFPVSQRKSLKAKDKVKILAVFGDNQTSGDTTLIGIDEDWKLLQKHLIDAEFLTLEEPTLEQLHDQLWENNPDILYYGGHSSIEADGTTTKINIKKNEKIEINDLINALKRAAERGLQLAIFNSCEGLGIARQLADSSIPQVIVMREAVPDEVARRFLQYFLKEFAGGKPLYLAVREARGRMGYLENKYPGATWLPMIFQNPAELPYTWRQIRGITINNQASQQQVNQNPTSENQSQNPQTRRVNVPFELYCSNCGVQNPVNANFCYQCGRSLFYTQSNTAPTNQTNYQNTTNKTEINNINSNNSNTVIHNNKSLGLLKLLNAFKSFLHNEEESGAIQNNSLPTDLPSVNNAYFLNNRYKKLRTIGSGGFGDTFLAEDTHLPSGRRCVIKQLKPVVHNPTVYQVVQDRFAREAAILEDLGSGCDQIPSLYAYFTEHSEFYLVQEYIEGVTLTQILRQGGNLSQSNVQELLVNILPVLDYIHGKRIVHRDIKPDNILIRTDDGKPVLIDFGAVKEIMGAFGSEEVVSSIIIGTPGFMPTEQAVGRPVYASDIYSLGLTAIYLLTGRFPQELATNPATGEIEWHNCTSGVTPAFAEILDKSIQPTPRDRYTSAKEMLQAILLSIK